MQSQSPTTQQIGPNVDGGKVLGLDSLRLFALLLVTWQHAASVLGAYADTQWHGISPGQTGVGVFCAISGYLAFYTEPRSARDWFFRRLLGIFPSYWVVTVFAFAMASAFGSNKPITVGLFVSQMLGLGYFTHGWQLINVVSWFISLILACYSLSFVARFSGYPVFFWGVVTILALLAITTRTEVDLSRHLLSFSLGALFSIRADSLLIAIVAVVLIGLGVSFDAQLFYGGFALLMLVLAVRGWVFEPLFIKRIAKYSYEYFLVHGICLVAATKFISSASISVGMAIIVALIMAFALRLLDQHIQTILKRIMS